LARAGCCGNRFPRAFPSSQNSVNARVVEPLHQAAGPARLNKFYAATLSQSEVNAHIVVRNIAGATTNLIDLFPQCSFHGNSSANPIPIRSRADGLDPNPVVGICAPI